ncbi:pleckstrin homology domain-containing family F member 2 isoform X2 [Lethenteron reissneri]|nr:pleckstrin homology domain-containing family F member 2 isoform X2 [Lethenteron reissneri]
MAEPLASSEENSRRIARIESCFGAAGRPLMAPGRVLVGEGTLTKLCRKGPKPRQFFLFDDIVVYGAAVLGSRRYANQRVLALEAVAICTLPDEGELSNGWLVQTPAKSFKVFAATESERAEWISHIERCVRELRAKRGLPPLPAPCNSPGPGGASSSTAAVIAAASPADGSEPAAWWVPDSSASACMRCQRSRFNALNRRHHCRKCGIVVCGACSDRRFLLPSQSSRPLRVCIGCFDSLTAAAVMAPAGPCSSSAADDLVDRVAKVTVANGNRGSSGAAEEGRPAVSRGRRGDGARTSNGTQDSSDDDDDDDDDDGGDGGREGGSGEDWADRSPIGNRTGFYS